MPLTSPQTLKEECLEGGDKGGVVREPRGRLCRWRRERVPDDYVAPRSAISCGRNHAAAAAHICNVHAPLAQRLRPMTFYIIRNSSYKHQSSF